MTTMTGYLYDAEGTRVAKGGFSTWSCDPAVNGFATTNDYILGPGGEQMTEMGVQAQQGSAPPQLAWQHTNVWAGGKLLATYDPTGLHFYFNDPLGSRRVQTDSAGVVERTCQNLPYGDGETCQPTPTENLFTGKERDTESGNDYFGARYYASAMGRWLSPDPKMISKQRMIDPQQWDMYSYARNSPLVAYDPDGKEVRFKDEATAQHAVSDYRAQLPKNQGGAVNYKAREGGGFMLTVDPKAAADAGSKSRLGELSTVATSKKVAEVNYVGKDDPITYNKGTNTDSPTQATSSLGQRQLGGVTLFEQGSTPQSPANDLGYNSATPGATEIYVDPLSSHNLLDTGDPLMHETLEHFYPFTQTGDANQSAHPNSPEMPPKEDKPQ
jgi:RHS repeat-associated protein